MLAISVLASRASVSLPEVIENKSPGDDDQPRREFYVWLGDVSAEPAAPVFAEGLKRVGIRIHRRIVVTRHCPASMEDRVTVGGDKVAPDIVALRRAGRFLQPRQDEGEVGRMYAVSRSVLWPGMDIASIWLICTGRQLFFETNYDWRLKGMQVWSYKLVSLRSSVVFSLTDNH
jgi:hypothetical protein